MSTLKVEVCPIEEIKPHDNADRLEMARVKGWWVVTGKGVFSVGQKCIYIPIDSVLPQDVEDKLFPPDSKIRLHNSRIRTIKLRGNISQGMICSLSALGVSEATRVGHDLTKELGITKYEPPVKGSPQHNSKNRTNRNPNTNFDKYTNIENIKNYPNVFEDGEQVWVSEKLHGTSWRGGWVQTQANTWWKKVKKFFGKLPAYEFVFGSRNVQLQDKSYTGFYDNNLYAKMVEQYDLKTKLAYGEVLYGEVVGDGVQAGYNYGCKPGEHKLYVYDIKRKGGKFYDSKYIDYSALKFSCKAKGLDMVPTLYVGPYSYDQAKKLTKGVSVICKKQKVREGVVIKPVKEVSDHRVGRKVLKFVSDDYLLKKGNTDFH